MIRGLMLAVALFATDARAGAWDDVRWGMSESELRAHIGAPLKTVKGVLRYGNGLRANQLQDGVEIGGLRFRAIYQFRGGGLVQVLLRSRPARVPENDFVALRKTLVARFGPPDLICGDREAGEAASETIWVNGNSVLHASFLAPQEPLYRPRETAEPGVIDRPDPTDIDERLRRTRPIHSTRHAVVLRWRSADAADLASVACRKT